MATIVTSPLPVPPSWSSCTTSGELDQELQIDKAVLESISLLVPMAFRSS